jgi:hypothetical protein
MAKSTIYIKNNSIIYINIWPSIIITIIRSLVVKL